MLSLLLMGVFLILLILGMPIAFSMGVSSLLVIKTGDLAPLVTIPNRLLAGVESFTLLAVPFFILAGALMNTGGVTKRLVRFATALVGHITGGLGHVVVVTNMIMAGMSGSALADCAGTGSVLIPAMEKAGFKKDFSSALVAAASTIGPIIPPSIPFVIYGAMADVSIGQLFLAGFIPGTLLGLYLMVYVYYISRKRGYSRGNRVSLAELIGSFKESFLALLMPFVVIGGMLLGMFTATEAAVVACVYALFIGAVVYREVSLRDLPRILIESSVMVAKVMYIIAVASVFGWLMANLQVGLKLVELIQALSINWWVVLLLVNILLLILGCFMETTAILTIMTGVLLPLVDALGISRVHFGVLMVLNLMIGLSTPPVGMSMYVVTSLSQISIPEFVREWLPMFIVSLIVLLMVTYLPNLVLFLPNLFMS